MMKKLLAQPLYLLLLPLFFVLHGLVENFGFVRGSDAGLLFLYYALFSAGLFLLTALLFKNRHKAGLFTLLLLAFYFFFGSVHHFTRNHAPGFFSRYAFLLPTLAVLLAVAFLYLKKRPANFQRLTLFINVLLAVYIIWDAAGLAGKITQPPASRLQVYPFAKNQDYQVCDTCTKPDIYFLLFDGYGSSGLFKQHYQFDNSLDSFLIRKGFRIQTGSRANYNFTPFSMASILNMSYIKGIKDVQAVTAEDYEKADNLISNNETIRFLDAHHYDIVNYSVFDLAGHPAFVEQSFFSLKTKLITGRTLFEYLNKDLGWLLVTHFPFNLVFKQNHYINLENNQRVMSQVKGLAAQKSQKPRFVYAHFLMPHPPYFFDRYGQPKDSKTLWDEYERRPVKAYLEYVEYTNSQIRLLVDDIQEKNPSAVIVLMGDHSNRDAALPPYPTYFQNLNAVYLPAKDYRQFYDSITGANQFRVIFNTLFQQSLPLLPDSSIVLTDK